jgi:acyl-coenzyme A thioesterase PaaI-like protein
LNDRFVFGEIFVITEIENKTVDNICDRVHPECVVCSIANASGLHLKFDVSADGNVKADFQCNKAFEGYPGILHGGVISTILDGAMGHCIFALGQTAVTVEMTTKFRNPVIIGSNATVLARITRSSHPLYLLEAEIIQNGEIKATAKSKFYNQPGFIKVLSE